MKASGYEKLIIWQKSDSFAFHVYTSTKLFPKDESYGITSQLRRAALSIPTNIVEGYSRNGKTEFRHFISIALGSLAETKYLLDFAYRLNYLKENDYVQLKTEAEECGKVLWSFYTSLA